MANDCARFVLLVSVVAMAAIGCSDPGPKLLPDTAAADTTAATDTTDDPDSLPQRNPSSLAIFGRYRVDTTPDVVRPTATSDGDFIAISSTPAGNRVGRIGTRLAVWAAEASAPTYMFRADTTEPAYWQARISDRLEVVLSVGKNYADTIYAWRDGKLKIARGSTCVDVRAVNARGMMGMNTTCTMYTSASIGFSPFAPDTTRSGRFARGTSCSGGGRTSSIVAIDDENDFLKWTEFAPIGTGGVGYLLDGGGGTCTKVPAFGYVESNWTTIRSGWIGGSGRLSSSAPLEGLLSDGAQYAAVDRLLTAAAAAEWRVESVLRIDPGKTLVCQAVSRRTGHKATIKLVPDV